MAIFKLLIVVLVVVAFMLGALWVYFWYKNQESEREHELREKKLVERQELNQMVWGEGTGADDIDRELEAEREHDRERTTVSEHTGERDR